MKPPPDYGQSREVIDYLRFILRGHATPTDQEEANAAIMFFINEYYGAKKPKWSSDYKILRARVVGPGFTQDNDYDGFRITVVCERTQEGIPVVCDVCLG